MQDPSQVNYNSELLLQVVAKIMDSNLVRDKMTKILSAKSAQDLNEVQTRNFLYGLLEVFSGGQRESCITNMTIKEFMAAQVKNGMEVVRVAKHKTAASSGPASIVFSFPRLWGAINYYIKLFR